MILHEMTKALLKKKYHSAKQYQTSKDIKFDLTFDDYMTLWIKNVDALLHLDRAVRKSQEDQTNKTIKLDYCLTWKPGYVRTNAPMNLKTAMIADKETSKKNCRLRKGEHKTERAKTKLRKPKSNTDNMSGPKAAWTEERKAARRAAMSGKKRGPYNKKTNNEEIYMRKGTKHKSETIEILIEKANFRANDESYLEKLRKPKSNTENMKGRKSYDHKAAISASMKGRKRGPYKKKTNDDEMDILKTLISDMVSQMNFFVVENYREKAEEAQSFLDEFYTNNNMDKDKPHWNDDMKILFKLTYGISVDDAVKRKFKCKRLEG